MRIPHLLLAVLLLAACGGTVGGPQVIVKATVSRRYTPSSTHYNPTTKRTEYRAARWCTTLTCDSGTFSIGGSETYNRAEGRTSTFILLTPRYDDTDESGGYTTADTFSEYELDSILWDHMGPLEGK